MNPKQSSPPLDAQLQQRIAENAAFLTPIPEPEIEALAEINLTQFQSARAYSPASPSALKADNQKPSESDLVRNPPELKKSYLAQRLNRIFGQGHSLKSRIRAIPLLGYSLSLASAMLLLPRHLHRDEVEKEALKHQLGILSEQIQMLAQQIKQNDASTALLSFSLHEFEQHRLAQHSTLIAQIELMQAQLSERLQQLEFPKTASRLHRLEMLDIGTRMMKIEQLETGRKLAQLSALNRISQGELTQLQERMAAFDSRVRSQLPSAQVQHAVPEVQSEEKHGVNVDQLLSDFEEAFRGTRESIKERLRVYLPYLAHFADSKLKTEQVVDIGCGRGEWLELMAEQGLPAIGIDLNAAKVDQCLAAGYVAKRVDGIAFLRSLKPGSVSCITGFHVIEHLPFETMIALFDAAYVALKAGGLIIFETPNPENLIVGACNFYFDPTHLHPIVPDVARFIAQQRGFAKADILRLHPYPDDHRVSDESDTGRIINKHFFGAQDYAVIAHK